MAIFTDAQAMSRLHPQTFDAPAPEVLAAVGPGSLVKVCAEPERFWVEVLAAVGPGSLVKVCAEPERFWVEVLAVEGDGIMGRVSNDLVHTARHGLRDGDNVTFEKRHIYDVLDEERDQLLAATPFPNEEGEAMCQHIASEFHARGGKADSAVAAALVKEFYAWVRQHPEISQQGVMVMQMRITHLSKRH